MAWHGPHRSFRFTLPSGRQDLSGGEVNLTPPPSHSWVNPVPLAGSGRPSQDSPEAAGGAAPLVPGRGLQTGG